MEAHDRNAVHLPSSYSGTIGWIEHLPLRFDEQFGSSRGYTFNYYYWESLVGGEVGLEGSLANDFIVFYRDKFWKGRYVLNFLN